MLHDCHVAKCFPPAFHPSSSKFIREKGSSSVKKEEKEERKKSKVKVQ